MEIIKDHENGETFVSYTCRGCFMDAESFHSLFIEYDLGLTLADILKLTTSIEVSQNDGLPPYLCESCSDILVKFYNFKDSFVANEEKLRKLLQEFKENKSGINHEDLDQPVNMDDDPSDSFMADEEEMSKLVQQGEENKSVTNHEDVDEPVNVKDEPVNDDNSKEEYLVITSSNEVDELNPVVHNANNVIIEGKLKADKVVTYSCEYCNDIFLQRLLFSKHMKTKHKIHKFDYVKYVSTITVNKVAIEENNEATTNITQIHTNVCSICQKEFETQGKLRQHIKEHKSYMCDQCGATFVKKSYLDEHSEVHCSIKRYVCNFCGKKFQRRTVLAKHRKLHTHPRMCVCEICGKRFNDKGTLKTHIMLIHTRERNFECDLCGLKFPLKSTLQKHLWRHNENRVRDFLCSLCPMAYRDKSSLNRHVLINHTKNVKKPTCTVCGNQYTTLTNLYKHRKKQHQNVTFT